MTFEEAVAAPGRKVQISGDKVRDGTRGVAIFGLTCDGATRLAWREVPEAEHGALVEDLMARGVAVADTDASCDFVWVIDADGVEVYDSTRKVLEARGARATVVDGRVVARADIARVFSYASDDDTRRGVKAALRSGKEVELVTELSSSAMADPVDIGIELLIDIGWAATIGIAIATWAGTELGDRIDRPTTPDHLVTSEELRAALAAGDHAAVIAFATDLDLVEARCRGSVDALLADLAFVLREAPAPLPVDARLDHISGSRLDRVALTILESVLDACREILASDPSRLVPILHDELYWYDAPARAQHVEGAMAPGERQLWRWVESCAVFKVRSGVRWLRSLRPPQTSHAALPRWRTAGTVRAVSPDGTSALIQRDELCLLDLRTGAVRKTFAGATQGRFALAGERFLLCTGTSAALWSTDTLAPSLALGTGAAKVRDAVFSRDGQVVFVDEVRQVRAYRVADGTCLATRRLAVTKLVPCGDGALLLGEDGWQLWDPAHGRRRSGAGIPAAYADWTVVSPAGDRVVTYENGTVEGFVLPGGNRVFQVKSWASTMAFHPSGSWVASSDGRVRDATTGEHTATLPLRDAEAISFDPAGRFVLAAYWNRVEIVELAAAAVVARVHANRPRVQWSGDGRVVVVNDRDSAVVAELTALVATVRWRDDARRVRTEWTTRFSPSGDTLIVDHDGGIAFWDTLGGVIRRFVEAQHLRAFSATGHRVFAGQGDQLIALSTEDGAVVWTATLPHVPEGRLGADVHAADAHGVVLHGHPKEQVVIALEMDDGRERYRVAGMLVLHDREVFLTRDANDVTLRAVETGAEIVTLRAVGGGRVALSADRRWLAVCDHQVTIWDLTTRTLRHTCSVAHTFSGFHFSEDGAALVIASYQTQQSGNQDWNAEQIIDLATGNSLGSNGWWDQDAEPDVPRELAPGIFREGDQLRVDGKLMPLPDKAVVCAAASGALFVASTATGRVELLILTAGRG